MSLEALERFERVTFSPSKALRAQRITRYVLFFFRYLKVFVFFLGLVNLLNV